MNSFKQFFEKNDFFAETSKEKQRAKMKEAFAQAHENIVSEYDSLKRIKWEGNDFVLEMVRVSQNQPSQVFCAPNT